MQPQQTLEASLQRDVTDGLYDSFTEGCKEKQNRTNNIDCVCLYVCDFLMHHWQSSWIANSQCENVLLYVNGFKSGSFVQFAVFSSLFPPKKNRFLINSILPQI